MYVCVCAAVTDHQIHQAVQRGASRLQDLREDLGVAAECGRCASCAKQCLREARSQVEQPVYAAAA